jgi:hypothetical protein
MTLEIASRADNIQTTGSWKSIFMKHPLLHLLFVSLLAGLATPSTVCAQVQAAPANRGLVLTTVANNCLSLRFAT